MEMNKVLISTEIRKKDSFLKLFVHVEKWQKKENHYSNCFITEVLEGLEIKQPIFYLHLFTFYSFAVSLSYMCFVDSPIYLLD